MHEEIQNRSEVRLCVYKGLTNNYWQKWKFSKCSRHGHEVDICGRYMVFTNVYSCLLKIPSRCCGYANRCPVRSFNVDRVKFPSVKSRTKVKEKHYNKENQIKLHHCKICVSCLIHIAIFFNYLLCNVSINKTSILVMVACNHRH